jgi:catechol 2,3-dioxygenase-like lactoylglutathione lyase family enzyme
MIDHLELRTRTLDKSVRFYSDVLEPLGYRLVVDGPGKGFGAGGALDFFIAEGESSANVHFAFAAPDRPTIDRIYALAGRLGYELDRAPALAPHIHPHYYAGYLRDPDGHLVEFVCQRPE